MVRAAKKVEPSGEPNPEAIGRKRLKGLAFSNNLLSETPANSHLHLKPSKTVVKHHGSDILRKSQRKNRFLFSFPGLIAPTGGGKIGELKDLGTKNPILYLDFPQGRMKLFGTIVYPKSRYLTLQFSRSGKNAMCEDYFDNMIVFSDAWWIGTKDGNPEEARLEFPKELYEGQPAEYDFKGGAGSASVVNPVVPKTRMQCAEQQSPKTPAEDDLSDSENNNKGTKEVVPVRHSERTPRKSYKLADASSDESPESSPDLSEHEEKKESPCMVIGDVKEDAVEEIQVPKENKKLASGSTSKKVSQVSSTSAAKEVSSGNCGSLVQATLSTLFKKVEEKAPRIRKKLPSSKDSTKKLQNAGSKRNIDLEEGSKKRVKQSKDNDPGGNKAPKGKKRKVEDEVDDIEEVSSDSEDMDESDEDWTA
ncbi:DNA-binding protein RHL1-like isoform X2 [Prosopis cineraria]|uniref:DNA-binding protein RHL1-like isoform X2 n=1 Tax=Prosopis cineraria TaxID=364024 RepID=UPI00240EAECD|nr:DNA-binding protein RHL1-like isoform X2 [Prosopis cineraria]